jgi:hypothetical protein
MVIATGTVRHGTIELDATQFPEGATVMVLASEGDETFSLSPEDEAKLMVAVQEADRRSLVPASDVLARIRRP